MKTPDRDVAIDRLLSRSARTGALAEPSPQCLDAETLAAWVEGSLPAHEAAAAELHASSCARCQTMLASLVRTMPAAPVAQPWWRKRWTIAGLVPLTAGAIALAIWVRTPEPTRTSVASSTDEAVTRATPSPAEERRERQATAEQPPRAAAPPRPSAPASNRTDAPQATAKDAQKQSAAEFKDQDKKTEALQKADQAVTDTLAAAAPRAAAGRRAGANEPAPLKESVARSQFRLNAAEIAAPGGASRWRIGAAGSIQRSVDSGATWETVPSGTTQDLVAGAAPSPAVCWIVGRGGTVMLASDGRTWRVLPFPEPVDLVAVQARDALSAAVMTADGRTFRTADGGQRWTAVQEF